MCLSCGGNVICGGSGGCGGIFGTCGGWGMPPAKTMWCDPCGIRCVPDAYCGIIRPSCCPEPFCQPDPRVTPKTVVVRMRPSQCYPWAYGSGQQQD